MRFLLSNKFLTRGALLFLILIAYNKYKEPTQSHYFNNRVEMSSNAGSAQHTIQLDLDKEYKNYSIIEKIIYNLFKDKIEVNQQKLATTENIIQPQVSNVQSTKELISKQEVVAMMPTVFIHRGAKIGNEVTFSYFLQDSPEAKVEKKIILGKQEVAPVVENALFGMKAEQRRLLRVSREELDQIGLTADLDEDSAFIEIIIDRIE